MKKSFLLVLSLIVSFATIGCNSNGESIETTTPLSSSASDNSETAESSNSTIAPPTFYTIIYNGNGNTSGFIPNQIVDFGTYFIIEQNAFLKDGYIFSKWNTKSDGTGITYRPGERLLDITTPFDDSITLYAIWEGKDYTVTLNNVSNSLDNIIEISFDSNGGVGNFPNQLIGNGNRFVQFPGVPTRELYAFTGWYYDVDCARLFDFESDLVYQNSTLYAGWEKMIGIGSWHDDKTQYNCYVDTTIYNRENKYLLDMFSTSQKDPIYLYFTAYMSQTIDIHYCSSEVNKTILFSVIDFSTNTYLFTEVKATSRLDTITFNMEIGHVYRICAYIEYMTAKGPFLELYFSNCSYPVFNNNFIEHVIAGSPYNLYVPKLKGLSFVGWADSFGNILTDENGCSLDVWDIYQDTSLYGKWVANENTISYILNGGVNSIDNPDAFTVLDSICLLDPFPRTGYTFDGWYLDPLFTKRIRNIINGNVYTDITLYAKWNPNSFNVDLYVKEQTYGVSHTVSFCMNGATSYPLDPVTLNYGAILEYPSEPFRNGYYFRGWFDDALCESIHDFSSNITSDIVLYAGWEETIKIKGYHNIIDPTVINKPSAAMSGKLNNFDPHYFYFRSNYTTSASIYFKKGTKESYISNYYCLDIYDLTQHKLLTRRTVKNSSYEKLTLNFIAGNAYYMRIDKTGSDYDPHFVFYFEGFDTIVGTGLNSDQTSHIFRSVSVFYEQSYILPVPTNGNIKFAGWYDKNGIQFTDDNGHSFKEWSLLSDITLYAHWQI